MNRKITFFLVFIFIALLSGCKKYDAFGNEIKTFDELKKANWLVGEWQFQTDSTAIRETWKRENDSTLSATSFYIQNNKDTLHQETIELVEDKKVLIYTATIIGENNNEPVSYQKTIETETELIFENPSHNYPKVISYKKLSNNQFLATISGNANGKLLKETYKLTRAK